jgi:hypothetical protein
MTGAIFEHHGSIMIKREPDAVPDVYTIDKTALHSVRPQTCEQRSESSMTTTLDNPRIFLVIDLYGRVLLD